MARHPAAREVVVNAHLVEEGIFVEKQRLRDCLRTEPDLGGITGATALGPPLQGGPVMKFICFK